MVFTLDEWSRGTFVCNHSLPSGNYPWLNYWCFFISSTYVAITYHGNDFTCPILYSYMVWTQGRCPKDSKKYMSVAVAGSWVFVLFLPLKTLTDGKVYKKPRPYCQISRVPKKKQTKQNKGTKLRFAKWTPEVHPTIIYKKSGLAQILS